MRVRFEFYRLSQGKTHMPVEIGIPPSFPLQIRNNETRLQLPAIDLIPMPANQQNILITNISCTVEGTPQDLAEEIQSAYKRSFRSQTTPFSLHSLTSFSPSCRLERGLLPNADCTLDICVEYVDSNNAVQSRETAQEQCHLFFLENDKMLEHTLNSDSKTEERRTQPDRNTESEHPGWLAIDFGTSNSTVTVFDQKERCDTNELSRQQKERLFELVEDWLGSQDPSALFGVRASDWETFLDKVRERLDLAGKGSLSNILASKNSSQLLEAMRLIELCLDSSQPEQLRRVLSKKLNDIYHEGFQVPPLQYDHIIPVELDPNTPRKNQIISELEIESVGDPLGVSMGYLVTQSRQAAISQAKDKDNWKEIEGKFHPSPKRYLIDPDREQIDVYWEGRQYQVPVEKLVQAAWHHLIALAEKDKDAHPEKFSKGRFDRAIVTYPTIASPGVRREIEQLFRLKLGFTDVKTNYDEAVAAAIFYLWREFSGNKTIGLEAFKTRCRRSGDKWAQNVLVLDIGGGTTDLALIRLLLEEIDPFKPGEDRGAGGRYYVITPELMGSSGHLRLGGELITLKVFQMLKAAIADCLLTAFTEGNLENAQITRVINSLEPEFRNEDGKFRSHSLLDYVIQEGHTAHKLALDCAEQVLPTRWKGNPERLQAFYTLWDLAEKAKLKLSKGSEEFELPWNELTELLSQNGIELQPEETELSVKLNRQQFELAAFPAIEEAIGIAKGLLESRLPIDESTHQQEPLDWLILSGQTCNLDLVRHHLNQTFSESKFEWNPARITFVPEYAKLATSVGACYAERLQQFRYDPEGAKPKLQNGYSEIEIRVKNLLYNLPCSFWRMSQDLVSNEIFKPRQPLYQLDQEGMAKARSEWLPVQPTNFIERQDFSGGKTTTWANFAFEILAKKLGIFSDTYDYLSPFRVQFEVNQKLEFSLLVRRGNPYYLMASNCPFLDANRKISEEVQEQTGQGDIPQQIISDDSKLQWEIVVGVLEESPRSVFKAGESLDKDFQIPGNGKEQLRKGLISKEPLPSFPQGGKHTFYAYYPSLAQPELKPIYLGELTPPDGKTKENYLYYVTLDDQGLLRIHEGEVPYWTSDNPEVLKDREGCVFRVQPEPLREKDDDKRNPFSGIH